MHLALGEQRVDDRPGVVDRGDPAARAARRSARSISTDRGVRARAEHEVGAEAGVRLERRALSPASRRSRTSRAAISSAEPAIAVDAAGERADAVGRRGRVAEPDRHRRRARRRARRRRSARTSSRGPGRAGRRRVCAVTRPSGSTATRASSNWPPARSTYSATPVPTDALAVGRVARARRARPPGPGSARSRRSRTLHPSGVWCGNARTRLRRRSSSGSSPSSRAAWSTVSSRKAAASGPPGAAARAGRHLVGARADDGHARGRDRVAAAHQHRGRVRRRGAVREQVGAEVGEDPRAHGEHAPVGVERQLDVGLHAAALVGGEEVLEPVLGPLDRAAEPQRRGRGRRHLGRRRRPWSRTRRRRRAGSRGSRPGRPSACASPASVRCVSCAETQTVSPSPSGSATTPRGSIGTATTRGIACRARDHVRGGGERAVDVAAGALEPQQLLGRRARIDDRVERLVVDLDELGGVLGQRARGRPARARPPGRRSAPRRPPAAGAARRGAPRPAAPATGSVPGELGGRERGHARPARRRP